MCPMNVMIVRVVGSAIMAIIQIQIVGNSFTLIPSDALCIVIRSGVNHLHQISHKVVFHSIGFQGAKWSRFAVRRCV